MPSQAYSPPRRGSIAAGVIRRELPHRWLPALWALALWFSALGCGGATAQQAQAREPSAATLAALDAAHLAERARRYDRAELHYRQAIDRAPDRASRIHALREYSAALMFWGELTAAAAQLERLVTIADADARGWHDLGIVRQHLGDTASAERALRKSEQLAPKDVRPKIALGALFLNTGRPKAALATYRALAELDLSPRLRRAVEQAIALIVADGNSP